jgi:hypothetical protein
MQRSSAESHFSTVNEISYGRAASILPICIHSFERQPTMKTAVVFLPKIISEALRGLSLNLTITSVEIFLHYKIAARVLGSG